MVDDDRKKMKVSVTIGNVQMSRPTVTSGGGDQTSALWPREARLRSLTYSSSIFVKMTQTTETVGGNDEREVTSKIINYRLCSVSRCVFGATYACLCRRFPP